MTKIVNLTPHDVTVAGVVFPASGSCARLTSRTETFGSVEVDGLSIPLTRTVFGEVCGLPAAEDGTIYIVSALVAGQCKGRDDVFPSESLRDEQGRIVGCKSLGRV